jgi:integrase
VGRDVSGTPKWASRNFRGTRREAKAALAAFKAHIDRRERLASHPCSVAELLDRWLAHKQGTLTPATYEEYRRTVERDLKPVFGRIRLDKLTTQQLDRFYKAQSDRGLSPRTVRKQHSNLSAALNQAVKWDLIVRNPAAKASPPATKKTRVRPPRVDVVKQMVSVAERDNPILATAIAIGAVTGARRGELCALRWSHVDWEDHTLTFEQSITRLKGTTTVGDTKTHQWRTLALDEALETVLRRRKAAQEKYAGTVGVKLVADPYILSLASDGSAPYKPSSLTQAYKRVAKRVGITSHIHELRHFSATTAIASGADIRTVSGRLGHAQTSTTLDIYADAVEQRDRGLAGVLGSAVLGTVDSGPKTDAGDAPAPA